MLIRVEVQAVFVLVVCFNLNGFTVRQSVALDAWVHSQAACVDVYWIKWHWNGFCSEYFSFSCQFNFTSVLYTYFIHLPPPLYNFSN
jgi:hypothetical protein